MNDLWEAIARIAVELHRDRIDAIAKAIAEIRSCDELKRIRVAFGPSTNENYLEALRVAWSKYPAITPRELSSAFLASSQAAEQATAEGSVQLVWTGPKTGLIPTRNTEQVIIEVIDLAKSNLFVVSYVFYNARSIVEALNRAILRGVHVNLLLESSTEHGGTIRGDSIQAMNTAVPEATIYVWAPDAKRPENASLSASVHAKCAVADGEVAFITSANLTSAALERNMELGVLLRGGTPPERLHAHLTALITTREITRWN